MGTTDTGSNEVPLSSGPPSTPDAWSAKDGQLRTQLILDPVTTAAFEGEAPCCCGGYWRYSLRNNDRHAIWRCLHCGKLFQQETPIAEE